ncbi:hypothetical protein [Reyranella sp.]|jgi:AcrR family transcriptional regulator|uniref:hypothetical protein n=1 Tax=Reyranella sp. TaxID=1929291 RepID=UPI000BCE3878|nr:hypothetical protein [Reyranella sp.]OYY35583.1 MAG: hypothetical protein B7Y57_25730 [Rhodospirillales bacterium 35-66-84]OYZ91453.1 MAG: hypothetical protein B7Y08_25600 [Rhodospirillales bacterium 24-66-33]OZB21990.1 MAG: hypothetical protein B7X63_24525 [Rhodospirillales bacterium 39-66-50]HQS14993.1 hypothetical protein [Reyranella sp.]HQT10802.1 hypothetical protein [Reyranella sp.]
MTEAATPKRDGRHDRKARSAARIVQACRDFMQTGCFQPSMPAVARAAGCSHRNLFELFQTREKLLLEALRDEETRSAILAAVLKDSLPPQTEGDRTRLLQAIVLGRV